MARKRSILDDLVLLPWWVNLIIAAIVYFSLKYWVPSLEITSPLLKGFQMMAPTVAPIFSGLVVLTAIISAVKAFERGELLERQTSLKSIKHLSWRDFEYLIGEAFRRKGYTVIENETAGPDGGIDVVLFKDDHKTLVQCKNWRTNKVGVKVVRELLGVMTSKQADFGMVVCSGDYSKEAVAFAKYNKIQLIGGKELTRLIQGVQKSEQIEVKPSVSQTSCPFCKAPMVRRVAKRGKQVGNEFFGCSTYPKCKGTRNL